MGLLLSVLVACVGVVELLAFYSTVSRNFVPAAIRTSLSEVSNKYLEGLEQHRRYLLSQIALDNGEQVDPSKEKIFRRNVKAEHTNSSFSKAVSLNDKVKFSDHIEDESKDRSETPQNSLLVTVDDVLPVSFEDTTLIKELEALHKPRSRSPSPIPQRSSEQEIAFRRSPSPYPSLVLPVPRNSICNELLENATVSVAEVDEETISRSPTPEKLHAMLESKHNTTEYWTNKILVVPPTKFHSCGLSEGRKSPSSSLKAEAKEQNAKFSVESVLSSNVNICTNDDNEPEDENKTYDEQFLDSLDGVKKKKLSRSCSLRRSRKKKISNPNMSLDNDTKDDSLSSSSMQNNDAQTAKTLTEAANVLNNVKREAGGPSIASTRTSKDSKTAEHEPFWVNRLLFVEDA